LSATNERAPDARAAACVLAMKLTARLEQASIKRDVEVGVTVVGSVGDARSGLLTWRSHERFGTTRWIGQILRSWAN